MRTVTVNRHLVTVVVCVVLIFVAGIYANKAWNSQVVKDQIASAKQHQIAVDKQRRQAQVVADENAKLHAECTKEVDYYNKLTTLQKKNTPSPACAVLLHM